MSKVIDISHLKPSERGGVRERERERRCSFPDWRSPQSKFYQLRIANLVTTKGRHHTEFVRSRYAQNTIWQMMNFSYPGDRKSFLHFVFDVVVAGLKND